jgi:hypothetical protein
VREEKALPEENKDDVREVPFFQRTFIPGLQQRNWNLGENSGQSDLIWRKIAHFYPNSSS